MPFYAVRVGRTTGIYRDWSECQKNVTGVSGAKFAKFETFGEATEFMNVQRSKAEVTGSVKKRVLNVKRKVQVVSEEIVARQLNPAHNIFMMRRGAVTDADTLIIYTDGACPRNGKRFARAGYGVHFPSQPTRDVFGPLPGMVQTNQRAELTAILRAVELTNDIDGVIEIRTDSMYSINCLTLWYQAWEAASWPFKKNLDLIREIIDRCRARKSLFYLVTNHLLISPSRGMSRDTLVNQGMSERMNWPLRVPMGLSYELAVKDANYPFM
jgi:ribonuclease HI